MNLKERWGDRIWRDATTDELFEFELNCLGTDQERLNLMLEVLSRLIARVARNDRDAVDLVQPYGWWEIDDVV